MDPLLTDDNVLALLGDAAAQAMRRSMESAPSNVLMLLSGRPLNFGGPCKDCGVPLLDNSRPFPTSQTFSTYTSCVRCSSMLPFVECDGCHVVFYRGAPDVVYNYGAPFCSEACVKPIVRNVQLRLANGTVLLESRIPCLTSNTFTQVLEILSRYRFWTEDLTEKIFDGRTIYPGWTLRSDLEKHFAAGAGHSIGNILSAGIQFDETCPEMRQVCPAFPLERVPASVVFDLDTTVGAVFDMSLFRAPRPLNEMIGDDDIIFTLEMAAPLPKRQVQIVSPPSPTKVKVVGAAAKYADWLEKKGFDATEIDPAIIHSWADVKIDVDDDASGNQVAFFVLVPLRAKISVLRSYLKVLGEERVSPIMEFRTKALAWLYLTWTRDEAQDYLNFLEKYAALVVEPDLNNGQTRAYCAYMAFSRVSSAAKYAPAGYVEYANRPARWDLTFDAAADFYNFLENPPIVEQPKEVEAPAPEPKQKRARKNQVVQSKRKARTMNASRKVVVEDDGITYHEAVAQPGLSVWEGDDELAAMCNAKPMEF
jgi:hypothetical protein